MKSQTFLILDKLHHQVLIFWGMNFPLTGFLFFRTLLTLELTVQTSRHSVDFQPGWLRPDEQLIDHLAVEQPVGLANSTGCRRFAALHERKPRIRWPTCSLSRLCDS